MYWRGDAASIHTNRSLYLYRRPFVHLSAHGYSDPYSHTYQPQPDGDL